MCLRTQNIKIANNNSFFSVCLYDKNACHLIRSELFKESERASERERKKDAQERKREKEMSERIKRHTLIYCYCLSDFVDQAKNGEHQNIYG